MGEKITAKVETITPEIAKTMLGENVNNRRISRDNVNLFAREMRNGEWRFNGEAIKFGKDGRLLDGQHRLLAVIAADKPLTTLVIRGLEDETQQTMDSGKPAPWATCSPCAEKRTPRSSPHWPAPCIWPTSWAWRPPLRTI